MAVVTAATTSATTRANVSIGKMRLVRTCAHPAHVALSRQFQQWQVLNTSGDLLHPVSTETSNLEHESVQLFARSYATSVSSERVGAKNSRRRISKDERKSMVENFVKNYREMNAGKFPTASEARKAVGGSFYVVRWLLQKVIHDSKMQPVNIKETSFEKISVEKDEISINTEEISQAEDVRGELIESLSSVETIALSSKSSKLHQQPQPSSLVRLNDEFKDVGIESLNPTDEPRSGLHLDSETEKSGHEDDQKSDGSQPKELHESKVLPKRESHKVPSEEAEHKTQTSVWQNLKSFANEIFGMWKRS